MTVPSSWGEASAVPGADTGSGDHGGHPSLHLNGTPAGPLALGLSTVGLTLAGFGLVGARLAGSTLALPCPMDELFGLACPVCGTWRGATALARGDTATVAEQWTAVLVVVLLLVGAAVTIAGWARRRWPTAGFTRRFGMTLGLALAANWITQLLRALQHP